MSAREKIVEVLKHEKEDPVLSVAADILRALAISYGSAWHSELLDTLVGLWTIKSVDMRMLGNRDELVSKALKRLNELGLVQSEKRPRADLGAKESAKEELHTVKDLQELIKAFTADTTIDKYKQETI